MVVGAGALLAIALLYRPLLLSSLDPDLAAVRGVPVRLIGLLHLIVLALAVALSAITVGAILSTALLIGPAAIALRVAKRPGWAVLLAAVIGVAATWGGILVAYDSYDWTGGHGWPVSFCIVALIFVAYVVAGSDPAWPRHAGRRASPRRPAFERRLRQALFASFMVNTWIVATIVAAVAGIVGFFVVIRGASFAAHALPLGTFPGAAAASLIGVNPLFGLLVFSGLGVIGISQLARRGRRDLATALSLVMLLGLGALFLSLTTEYFQAVYALLFGEVLGVSNAISRRSPRSALSRSR